MSKFSKKILEKIKNKPKVEEKGWDESLYRREGIPIPKSHQEPEPESKEENYTVIQGWGLMMKGKSMYGKFTTKHYADDVFKWLEHLSLKEGKLTNTHSGIFERIFGREDGLSESEDLGQHTHTENVEIIESKLLDFYPDFEHISKGDYLCLENKEHFPFDKEIKKFIDGKPKRRMDSIVEQFKDFKGNVDGIAHTASSLMGAFETIVEEENITKFSKEEEEVYTTLSEIMEKHTIS
ncbi:hypothetical protein OAJ98_02225 [Deltaproteobacteria bacterium]|nr:hypothetical protein [Deltaproteobacteria bacterium]